MGHGHQEPVRAPQVEHQDQEPADQERHREQAGQAPQGLVGALAEDGADGGDVERPGGGEDQEHGEDMGRPPHHRIVHAGDPVALVLHVERGQAAEPDDRRQDAEEAPVARRRDTPLAIDDSFHAVSLPCLA